MSWSCRSSAAGPRLRAAVKSVNSFASTTLLAAGRYRPRQAERMSKCHPDIDRILFEEAEILAQCRRLGAQLAQDFAGRQPLFLITLTGAFMFAAELLKHVTPVPNGLQVAYTTASSYGSGTTSSGNVNVKVPPSIPVAGRHVILIEDIVDSGGTVERLRALVEGQGASSFSVVAMLDKPSRRCHSVDVQYVGFNCPDEFVVGYGLDFDEHYRSLPYIGVLKPSAIQRGQS